MAEDRSIPPRPDRQRVRLSRASWITIGASVAVAIAAIALFPRTGGDAPPLASLALIGTLITAVTSAALYGIVRRDLRMPSRIALSFAIAFVLIGVVKFVLAPLGLYEVNAVRALAEVLVSVASPAGASISAAVVFGLYAVGYWLVYRIGYPEGRALRRRRADRKPHAVAGRVMLVGAVLFVLAVSGIGIITLLLLAAPAQYLGFVFTSGVGIVVVIGLLVAATLIGATFRAADRLPGLVVDVGAIVSLFWLGLGFLALYHVLWLVYVLVLGSIWPLKTVVPK